MKNRFLIAMLFLFPFHISAGVLLPQEIPSHSQMCSDITKQLGIRAPQQIREENLSTANGSERIKARQARRRAAKKARKPLAKCPQLVGNSKPTKLKMTVNKNGLGYDKVDFEGRRQFADVSVTFQSGETLNFSMKVTTGVRKTGKYADEAVDTPAKNGYKLNWVENNGYSKSLQSPMYYRMHFLRGMFVHYRHHVPSVPNTYGCIGVDWLEAETLGCLVQNMDKKDTELNVIEQGAPQPRYKTLALSDVPWYRTCASAKYHKKVRFSGYDEKRRARYYARLKKQPTQTSSWQATVTRNTQVQEKSSWNPFGQLSATPGWQKNVFEGSN